MPTFLRRPILAFVLGAALVGAAAAGTAAYGALTGDERVTACYVPKTGALYVVGRDGAPLKCADGHLPIDWSVRGPQGPAGVFSGTFTSPNGAYSISVTDAGIVLSGPGSAVRLTGSSVAVESAGTITLQAGSTIASTSGGATAVQAGTSLALASGSTASLVGNGNVNVESSIGGVTVKGASATLEAVGPTHIKGALVDVNGKPLP
jgi:hypothetical protein